MEQKYVRIVSKNDPDYVYAKMKMSFDGRKCRPQNAVELKALLIRALEELHGELAAATTVDILKYTKSSNEVILRIPGYFLTRFWSAMTLLGEYRGFACGFTIQQISRTPMGLVMDTANR